MQKKDQRHSHNEIPMSRLMTKYIHTRPASKAAAEQTAQKKRPLRNPICMAHCPFFICPHQKKCSHIHDKDIADHYLHNVLRRLALISNPRLHHIPQLRCNTDRRICTADQACHQRQRKFADACNSEQKQHKYHDKGRNRGIDAS